MIRLKVMQTPREFLVQVSRAEYMVIGKLIDGRYQVTMAQGTGGLAQTYLALDTHQPGRPFCIVKHLPRTASESSGYQTTRHRIFREAQLLEKLGQHPQIPQFLGLLEQDQDLYWVQEFIEGSPLSLEIRSDLRWTELQVVLLLQQGLEVLAFVHRQGVIHQAIQPSNLIRRKHNRQLVLVNFGLATQFSHQSAIAQPAQTRRASPPHPHPSQDIHALGLLAIQALTGLVPPPLTFNPATWQSQVQVSAKLVMILNQMVQPQDSNPRATDILQVLQPLMSQNPSGQKLAGPLPLKLKVSPPSLTSASRPRWPEELPHPGVTTPPGPLVKVQNSPKPLPTPANKSPLLIGLGIGIATTLALAMGLYYVVRLLTTTPEAPKQPLSPPSKGAIEAHYSAKNSRGNPLE